MRLHITLDDATVGAVQDQPHAWDDDPAAWVRAQRAEPRRTG